MTFTRIHHDINIYVMGLSDRERERERERKTEGLKEREKSFMIKHTGLLARFWPTREREGRVSK